MSGRSGTTSRRGPGPSGFTDEAGITHELARQDERLGGPGALGVTRLIEIDDPAIRAVRLREGRDFPRHVYARLDDGTRVAATFDPRQVGADRRSSVRYMTFPVGGRVPAAVGIDLPALAVETALTPAQRQALEAHLAGNADGRRVGGRT